MYLLGSGLTEALDKIFLVVFAFFSLTVVCKMKHDIQIMARQLHRFLEYPGQSAFTKMVRV